MKDERDDDHCDGQVSEIAQHSVLAEKLARSEPSEVGAAAGGAALHEEQDEQHQRAGGKQAFEVEPWPELLRGGPGQATKAHPATTNGAATTRSMRERPGSRKAADRLLALLHVHLPAALRAFVPDPFERAIVVVALWTPDHVDGDRLASVARQLGIGAEKAEPGQAAQHAAAPHERLLAGLECCMAHAPPSLTPMATPSCGGPSLRAAPPRVCPSQLRLRR